MKLTREYLDELIAGLPLPDFDFPEQKDNDRSRKLMEIGAAFLRDAILADQGEPTNMVTHAGKFGIYTSIVHPVWHHCELCEPTNDVEPTETIHACPMKDEDVTPCCGRTPFELSSTDRMTLDSALVNCRALAPLPEPEPTND